MDNTPSELLPSTLEVLIVNALQCSEAFEVKRGSHFI